ARDLVEDHSPYRHLRLQHLDQVPGDRLAFAVLVRREQELVRVGELLAQVGDDLLLVGVDDVERLEAVVDVDAEPSPRLLLHRSRDLARAVGKVADVADARRHDEVVSEITRDRLRLRGRLDDDEALMLLVAHSASIRLDTRDTLAAALDHADAPSRDTARRGDSTEADVAVSRDRVALLA